MGREADQGHMMVEQCTIGVACTVRQGLLVLIHTLVHSAMVILVISHEVSIVLPGPGGRAAGPGWDHNYSGSSGHIHTAQGTLWSCVPCRGCTYSAPCTNTWPCTPSLYVRLVLYSGGNSGPLGIHR